MISHKQKSRYLKTIDENVIEQLNTIDYSVGRDLGFLIQQKIIQLELKFDRIIRQYKWNRKLKQYQNENINYLLPFLVCIKCHKKLKLIEKKLICTFCKYTYLTENGIPILLDKKLSSNEISK